MYALNNVTVQDNYNDAVATLRCPNSRNVTVSVLNAAVYYQVAIGRQGVGTSVGGEVWEQEVFMAPGYWNFDQSDFYGGTCNGIRFRNAVAGAPAQVTANA